MEQQPLKKLVVILQSPLQLLPLQPRITQLMLVLFLVSLFASFLAPLLLPILPILPMKLLPLVLLLMVLLFFFLVASVGAGDVDPTVGVGGGYPLFFLSNNINNFGSNFKAAG